MKTINSPGKLSSPKSLYRTIDTNECTKRPRAENWIRNTAPPALRHTFESRHDNDEEAASTKPSLISTILEQLACVPTKAIAEPREICYPRSTTSPPMSPPVIYVHRYRRSSDEKREPAPRSTIKSFDTEITAATSTDDDESTSLWLLEDGNMLRWLDVVDGRATPVVSNISSMRSNDSLPRPRLLELQKCACFDDDDVRDPPHAQSILMDNRNIVLTR